MSNKIYDTDFSKFLPNVLKKDESMMAIAKVVTEKLLEISNSIDKVLIYANIDKLPDEILDILAYDMHVDWYDETYPVEAKREVIKSSITVHKKMGTKYAVEKALRAVHPASCIEEWFEYGGNPYCFRIICDTTESKVQANYEEIVNTVNIYKRLSAHLDSVTYQTHATTLITTETGWYIYRTPLTGKTITGTEPERNRVGKEREKEMAAKTSVENYSYNTKMCGSNKKL